MSKLKFLESSVDLVKNFKCCECGCDCSMAAKRKHDDSEQEGMDCDSIVRVEMGDECAALREAVSNQQQAIQDLYAELEEERNASSSAANEAMSMILRLQREKAQLQMEAKQFKRFVEERTSHDQQELLVLEDLLYQREQMIQSLTCEIQAYKHRLMSFGFTESEADEIPPYEYPPLRCNVMHDVMDADNDDTDIEKYAFGETPRDRVKNFKNRITQLETSPTYSQMEGDLTGKSVLDKVVVGQSPRWTKHSRRFSSDSTSFCPELLMDSPRLNSSFMKIDEEHSNLKRGDNASEAGDDMSDTRVYTIDYANNGAPYNGSTEFKAGGGVFDEYGTTPRELGYNADFEDPYAKKLYMRLQALEADRESMRQTIISMRTDKAQIVLLKEIAQHLCKEMSMQRKKTVRKQSFVAQLPFLTFFKWITSIIFWRRKANDMKYMFGLPSDNDGLYLLINKEHGVRPWRYLTSTQLGD
ncbi:putative GTD-binding domain-containing protein [Lupinus albus]|uniref:Putative GTD-binding domain-containing protein n=1 Tax=Lupinus albus TaxID=3870 RepID=A0A6A4R9N2_LUPAL|nr:putative GTD-binding domain-containing protein [Lupinus albus]